MVPTMNIMSLARLLAYRIEYNVFIGLWYGAYNEYNEYNAFAGHIALSIMYLLDHSIMH
jgi:hypothetical protein